MCGVCALHTLHAHRYGNYTPLTEAGRLASILFAAVGIPICFRACAQLARWMLRYLVGRLCGQPSAEDRGVRTLLALAVWALLQVRLKLGLPYPYPYPNHVIWSALTFQTTTLSPSLCYGY